jgi:hypothetical protein
MRKFAAEKTQKKREKEEVKRKIVNGIGDVIKWSDS